MLTPKKRKKETRGRKKKEEYTDDDVQMMILHESGVSSAEIAARYDKDSRTVSRTVKALKKRHSMITAGANTARSMQEDIIDCTKGILLESIQSKIAQLQDLDVAKQIQLLEKLNKLTPQLIATNTDNDPFTVFEVVENTVIDAK